MYRFAKTSGSMLAGLLMAAAAVSAASAEPIKIAYIRSNTYVPYLQAMKMGYFKREGLEPEVVMLNNGPAEIAALVSGSADVAMIAFIPAINARAQGQPLKAFMTYNMEGVPGPIYNHFVASSRSGVKSLKDLAGKTVASNAAGGGCDLAIRDHLKAAGVPADKVNVVVIPFPQMQAALELGTIDAACMVDPFFTSVMQSEKIKGTDLAGGMIAGLDKVGRYAQDGYIATEKWLQEKPQTAARFMRAIQSATADLAKDRALYENYLQTEFQMPAATTSRMGLEVNATNNVADPKDFQPAIDAMVRTGLLSRPMNAEDFIVTIKP